MVRIEHDLMIQKQQDPADAQEVIHLLEREGGIPLALWNHEELQVPGSAQFLTIDLAHLPAP